MTGYHQHEIVTLLAILILALSLHAACGGDDDDSTPSDDDAASDDDADDDSVDDDADDDDGEPTYENFAKGFFEDYCTRCHVEPLDNAPMPLTTYDEVKDLITIFRIRVVVSRDMPPSAPLPPEDDLTKFRQWLDVGAPEN